MARLVAPSEDVAVREFKVEAPHMTVGRAPDNTKCIEDVSVSSHHAELVREGNDYLLRDLHSTNGTRVNGADITEHKLVNGDTVYFGRVGYRYETVAQRGTKPLPEIKRGINLAADQQRTSTEFQNVSPFRKRQADSSSRYLLWAVITLATLATIAFLGLAYRYFFLTGM